MESKALGRGLSALIPEKQFLTNSSKVTQVKTSEIVESSIQPRSNYDESKLSELISSIREKGILQPILVRPRDSGFEVIAGERRLRAAKILNISEVPVVIRVVDDDEALILALIENIQREELNAIEEAQAFDKLIKKFNFTQDAVAKSVGKDRSTIGNTLRLLKLPEDIQKSVFEKNLSEGHARALLTIENPVEQNRIFQIALSKKLSVRELESISKGIGRLQQKRKKLDVSKNDYIVSLEEDFQRVLGTKVRIQSNKKRGKIIIEYYSLEDLERLRGIIKK